MINFTVKIRNETGDPMPVLLSFGKKINQNPEILIYQLVNRKFQGILIPLILGRNSIFSSSCKEKAQTYKHINHE